MHLPFEVHLYNTSSILNDSSNTDVQFHLYIEEWQLLETNVKFHASIEQLLKYLGFLLNTKNIMNSLFSLKHLTLIQSLVLSLAESNAIRRLSAAQTATSFLSEQEIGRAPLLSSLTKKSLNVWPPQGKIH